MCVPFQITFASYRHEKKIGFGAFSESLTRRIFAFVAFFLLFGWLSFLFLILLAEEETTEEEEGKKKKKKHGHGTIKVNQSEGMSHNNVGQSNRRAAIEPKWKKKAKIRLAKEQAD